MDEIEIIKQLISETEESIRFFSCGKKPDRERSVCTAFLRCLGIGFKVSDLHINETDPPDIYFNGANFEIKEYLDDNRRRHEEYKKLLKKLKTAKKLSDLKESYNPPRPLTIKEVCDRVTSFIEKYARNYSENLCSTLDLMVYLNLNGYHLDDEDIPVDSSGMIKQGWRSVSIVSNSLAFTFFASESAPVFLRNVVGKIKNEWKKSGLFDLS
ncbi:MAG: DUF1780 domain-containing protein [Sedimentisphaerales bacterium]|nr:DUF1780 domain-containing protein [Sedimentisphaerales bacterium]